MSKPAHQARPRPALFRALGWLEPPREITIAGAPFSLAEVFKHDSWAATALYDGQQVRAVVKFHRQQPVLLFPMGWLGRWFARREAHAYRLLRDVPGIAREAGEVCIGKRRCPYAVAHFFLEGHPMHIDEKPDAKFFAQLGEMLSAMQGRGMAYADLNKRENILVGADGLPALMDFQVHFAPPAWALPLPFVRMLLRTLQEADRYHLHKHLLWHRPDLVPPGEHDLDRMRPRAVRCWRALMQPVTLLRRWLLVRLRIRSGNGLALTEAAPEKATRLALEHRAMNPAARLPGEE